MSNFLRYSFYLGLFLPLWLLPAPIRYQMTEKPMKVKVVKRFNRDLPLIYLDPGHGGLDFGAVIKAPHLEEKRLCLLTAHYAKRYLERLGYRVSLTRSRDFYVPLEKRVQLANRFKAGLYVSIHYNSCPNEAVDGIEIYYHEGGALHKRNSSKALAQAVMNRMVGFSGARARFIRKGNFLVIRETKMPSILVEAGFLTNAAERNRIRQKKYLLTLAQGLAEGINTFIKG
ncbi:MAG: N-acetylmuramoyl-L-alanine amidase [Parachlamydiales bacterium]|jgi:N-acetylmuramoyl-L-alanine amidase